MVASTCSAARRIGFHILAASVGLAFAVLAAVAPAWADVIEIGQDGSIVTHAAPAIYDSSSTEPRVIVPASPPTALSGRDKPWAAIKSDDRIVATIRAAAARHSVSADLVEAIAWRESRFKTSAVSPKGARGVMQLMPATARFLGIDPNLPTANIEGGVAYVAWLMRRYRGDLVRTLAAYNAGPGAVERYGGMPPYRETRDYVDAILTRLAEVAEAGRSRP